MTESLKYPLPTPEREAMEEALGLLWHQRETGVTDQAVLRPALEAAGNPRAYALLVEKKLIREEGTAVRLTTEGERIAADITRRHRLAERLLTDVLSLAQSAVDPNACVLEHIISPELSESICTLLGHPAECPHGLAIPPGDCCRRKADRLGPIVEPLAQMKDGESGRVSYLQLKDHPELHRLLALGLIPGADIHVHQTFPAFIVSLGETQLALETAVASRVYVRRG